MACHSSQVRVSHARFLAYNARRLKKRLWHFRTCFGVGLLFVTHYHCQDYTQHDTARMAINIIGEGPAD